MKTKILYLLLFIAVATSVYLTYERTIVRHDFQTIESELEDSETGSDQDLDSEAP